MHQDQAVTEPLLHDDRDVAESLLHVLRDPTSVVERVDERCVLMDREFEREVAVWLRPDSLAVKDAYVYLDLLHVERGAYVPHSVDEEKSVHKVTHDEHVELAEYLIVYRFTTLWLAARSTVGASALGAFDATMEEIARDLSRIPSAPKAVASRIYRRHFDVSARSLKVLVAFPGILVPEAYVRGLFRLCKKFVNKYLVLVKARVKPGESTVVRYRYRQEVEEVDLRADTRRRWPSRVVAWAWRRVARLLDPTATPGSFRIHIPWAKRTNHYAFEVEAVEGHFIARQGLLLQRKSRDPESREFERVTVDHTGFKWSTNSGQGHRAAITIRGASRTRRRIFVGVQNLELPGGSTSRSLVLAWFAFAGIDLFATLALVAPSTTVLAAGSLVLALLAVGAFARTPPRGNGVLGHPLLSRVAPPTLAFVLVAFVAWLASRDDTMTFAVLADAGVTFWELWCLLGFAPWAAICLVLIIVLGARRTRLVRNFQRESRRTFLYSKNFE